MRRTLLVAAVLVALAGCGKASPEDEVRSTAQHVAEALTSERPERACQYMVDHDGCIGSVATAKAMHMDLAAVAGIPDDWRARVAKAKITVKGNAATVDATAAKDAHYVRQDGTWLLDNS